MKKSLLILAAAATVGFASCGGGNNEGSLTPAQLDSIKQATAQATADSILNAQKMQSDSIANAQNAMAVDSLKRINDSLATAAAKPATTTKATTTKKTTKPSKGIDSKTPVVDQPAPEPTKTKQQTKFDQRNNNDNNISEQKKAEQKSKFDRRNNN